MNYGVQLTVYKWKALLSMNYGLIQEVVASYEFVAFARLIRS